MAGDNVANIYPEHVYHHYDPRQPEIDLEVNETTRGTTWSVTVKGCSTPEQAVDLYSRTATGLADKLATKDSDDAADSE